jgi:uncharacterized protein (TIGR02996 family)
MSLDDAFLHDIKANPDDDVPRLVYADWLEEQGDPARAEFIRLQCRLARTDLEDPLWPELKRQERAAFTPHLADWLGPLRPAAGRWVFRRGLLCVAFNAHTLLTSARSLAAAPEWRWVEELAVRWLSPGGMRDLAGWLALGQVVTLNLAGSHIGPEGTRVLAGLPHLGCLTSLTLQGNRVGTEGLAALAECPHLAHVTSLDLSYNDIRDAAGLTTSARLSRLTLLNLAGNPLTRRARVALRQRFGDRVRL